MQDIEAEKYDTETGTAGGKSVIASGSEVAYIATDGERYALLNTLDGTFRIETASSEDSAYPVINGVSIEEIFDGILFAG